MTYGSAVFINTRFQSGAEMRLAGKPFQRLSVQSKTVETVLSFFQLAAPG
jgi:hypothetical protein